VAALTITTMPERIASGNSGQAATTAASYSPVGAGLLAHGRQQQGDQQADDGDDHQNLDQGETAVRAP
jgi:hypothetical protein